MSFVASLRSEITKLTSTRLWWVLAIIMIGYVALCAGGLAALLSGVGTRAGGPVLPEEQLPLLIYSFATSIGYVFPVLLGALAVTSEFRFQSLTPTFLATPRRGTVLAGKMTALVLTGAVFGVLALIASMGAGVAVMSAFGVDPLLSSPDTWAFVGRSILAMALWAGIGVGLGALVPSQIAAIVIVLAFTQFLEPLLRFGASITDWSAAIGQFLPGAASDALVGSSIFTIMSASGTQLEWWQGALVLAGIAAVATAIGYVTSWRRDVS